MKLYLHEEFIRSSNTNAEVQFSKGSLLVTSNVIVPWIPKDFVLIKSFPFTSLYCRTSVSLLRSEGPVQDSLLWRRGGVYHLSSLLHDIPGVHTPPSRPLSLHIHRFRFSKSGQKVIVRDCGFFEADECTANKEYENTGATGTLCHCLTDDCNSAEKMRGLSSLLLLTTSIILTAF